MVVCLISDNNGSASRKDQEVYRPAVPVVDNVVLNSKRIQDNQRQHTHNPIVSTVRRMSVWSALCSPVVHITQTISPGQEG